MDDYYTRAVVRLRRMGDEDTTGAGRTTPPRGSVSAVNRFVASHGESARAVTQPVSRDQVRITLVGADGTLGDVLVRDLGAAEAVIAASSATAAEWDRELSAAVTLTRANRLRMAGGRDR